MAVSVASAAETQTRRGVCAPRGFVAGGAAAHIRGDGDEQRLDVAVVRSQTPCQVAGVFTRNVVKAAPVIISQLSLRRPGVQAVVLNSGNANACTGAQGFKDALQMCKAAGDACDLDPSQVLVCSTGVIGRPMPMERVVGGIRDAVEALSADGDAAAARAIMTTDTVPKEASADFEAGGRRYTVGGMAKGAGMIHPDMATLLAVITTDAPVAPGVLQPLLARVADETFNCVTVDGDTSTNDTVLLLANGQGGGDAFADGSAEAAALEAAVLRVCDDLGEQLVADAEGATKHFRVGVHGAASRDEARMAARTVAGSPLVKTAIHGCDPNWGRIVAALGRSGAHFALDKLHVAIGGVSVFENGSPVVANTERIRAVFAQSRIEIEVQMGAGEYEAHAWGCDLSADYVRINADYTT
jgi:glutamate N-acetyltransferase / amino-acid N-acetyltransferase